jgi:hypothetical protein
MHAGNRTKNGEVIEGEICLVVWVKKKLPKSQLEPDQVLPEEIEGVPVDVVEGEAVYTVCCSSHVVHAPHINGTRHNRFSV